MANVSAVFADDALRHHRRRNRPHRPAEINIGVMPGAGGTQPHAGRGQGPPWTWSSPAARSRPPKLSPPASSAASCRLRTLDEARRRRELCSKSPSPRLAKEAVLKAFETTLPRPEYERKLFYMLFATGDQKEGMKAFLDARRSHRQVKEVKQPYESRVLRSGRIHAATTVPTAAGRAFRRLPSERPGPAALRPRLFRRPGLPAGTRRPTSRSRASSTA